jgi:hypothetical protein
MGKENELVAKFIRIFGDAFYDLKTEVWDVTHKNRIDVIVYLNEEIALGIEFKKENTKDDRRHGAGLGEWMLQSKRYVNAEFFHEYHRLYERMPILVAPQITGQHLIFNPNVHSADNPHNNVNSFLFKSFNIGEFRALTKSHYIFNFNCKVVSDIRLEGKAWVCNIRPSAYLAVCNMLNIITDYTEQLNYQLTQNK